MHIKTTRLFNIRLGTVQSVLALAMSGCVTAATAPPRVIGTVVAQGTFRLDQATVAGNATVFEGSTLETNRVASSVLLGNGARLWMGSDSRGKLYGNRLVLEKGTSRLDQGSDFYYEAIGLTIRPTSNTQTRGTLGQIRIDSPNRIYVTALNGSFQVLNHKAELVVNMTPGMAYFFQPQVGATGTEAGANAAPAASGGGTSAEGGAATSSTAAGAATTGSGAAAAGAASAGAAGAGAGIGIGTIAVIGGVAISATVGGLAAVGSLPGQGNSEPAQPISR
ncbi:MAG: hypothetical protein ABI824_14670 [Acidobacteriota bacterium]